MSSALAIAGVTAVLRDRLNDGLVNHNVSGVLGSTVTVSVLPPDRVAPGDTAETSQINLFLYQVSPNAGWRNEHLPSHDSGGRQRLTNPPLALDLHYLVSAYSGGDLHAEILLGYAMQLMHEFPILTRDMIRRALVPSPDVGADLPPALRALSDCGLAEQLELLRITPQSLNGEEMSRLWTATQSSFRPSAAYLVSVVLIEATRPTRPTLPVLTRGAVDPVSGRERGVVVTPDTVPPLPTIETVRPAGRQAAAQLGEPVTLEGHHLAGAAREVRLRNERFAIDEFLPASGSSADGEMRFVIPPARAADFPVAIYEVSARLVPEGESQARETNRLALMIAPRITNLPLAVVRDAAGDASFGIDFTPQARAGQRVTLLLGGTELVPQGFVAPVASLSFIARQVDAGEPLARLRIDGIDSPVVDREATPPVFLDLRVNIT